MFPNKMPLGCLAFVTIIVFFTTEAVSGVQVKKAVGDEVSFRPEKPLPSPVNSITWKHRNNNGFFATVIEWDEDGFNIPNDRFKGITTLDEKTGEMTIKPVNINHGGEYFFEVNSKEKFTLIVEGGEVKKAVGDEVTFRPEKPLPSPVYNIIWKHKSSGVVIKVIEWDEDGFLIPNDRFKGITTLDKETGIMKIKPVNFNHIGEYFFEVNNKEQGEKITLTVANRVPKPVIIIEPTDIPDVVYLRCEYSETIIWRNSAGETLTGSVIAPKGESITVRKKGDPGNFYTCSLRNDVSEETSDPIYEKDLFKGLNKEFYIWIAIVLICMIFIILFLFTPPLYEMKFMRE